jgi:lipoyl(octanoyl) transferase
MEPFSRINPCGLKNIGITQTADLGGAKSLSEIQPLLLSKLMNKLDYIDEISSQQRGQFPLNSYPFEEFANHA